MRSVFCVFAFVGLSAGALADQLIYANESQVQWYMSQAGPGQWGVDDLHVAGGGSLSVLRFALGSDRFGGPVTTDATVRLALDDGNGAFGAEDPVLLDVALSRLVAPAPGQHGEVNFTFITVPLVGQNVVIPANALVWAGVNLATGGRQMLFAPPTVGATDDNIYVDGQPFSVTDAGYSGAGAGWELAVTPEPASWALLALSLTLIRRR